jgi:hypothetical protein
MGKDLSFRGVCETMIRKKDNVISMLSGFAGDISA